jgi:murein DD-endopeptidase MepM/ murein hydrolase activator NlpD
LPDSSQEDTGAEAAGRFFYFTTMLQGYSSIPERLHVVVTGEAGKAFSFVIQRDRVFAFLGASLLLLSILSAGTWFSLLFFQQKNVLTVKTVKQEHELQSFHSSFAEQLQKEIQLREHAWQRQASSYETVIKHLKQEQDAVVQQLRQEKEQLICQYEEELSSAALAESAEKAVLLAELEQAKHDKEQLLEKTAGRLDERSRLIESLMSGIGVELRHSKGKKKATANSGGPFMAADFDEQFRKDLLRRSDRYIKTIQKMPLGLPIHGRITSGFGRRTDPFNHRPAFHGGIDFKGRVGSKVTATADGVVKSSGYDADGFGNYVIVRHGGGYETLFGHLSTILCKRGDTISRGDVIGLLGNTGRSTGPHLHYEIHRQGRPVDPQKYLSVAKLSFTVQHK